MNMSNLLFYQIRSRGRHAVIHLEWETWWNMNESTWACDILCLPAINIDEHNVCSHAAIQNRPPMLLIEKSLMDELNAFVGDCCRQKEPVFDGHGRRVKVSRNLEERQMNASLHIYVNYAFWLQIINILNISKDENSLIKIEILRDIGSSTASFSVRRSHGKTFLTILYWFSFYTVLPSVFIMDSFTSSPTSFKL